MPELGNSNYSRRYVLWQPEEEQAVFDGDEEFEVRLEGIVVEDPDESDRSYVTGVLGSYAERLGPELARDYARTHSQSHYVRSQAARRMGFVTLAQSQAL